jgi:hypothetical protein
MSESKKSEKIIRVNNLVIHAENVEIIDAKDVKFTGKKIETPDNQRRDPWGFFWGRRPEESRRVQERERENFDLDTKEN